MLQSLSDPYLSNSLENYLLAGSLLFACFSFDFLDPKVKNLFFDFLGKGVDFKGRNFVNSVHSIEFSLNYTKLAIEKYSQQKRISGSGDRTQDLLRSTLMPCQLCEVYI